MNDMYNAHVHAWHAARHAAESAERAAAARRRITARYAYLK